MPKTIKIFTNKFAVGQRVRNVMTGYAGTIIEVDPNSYNPPRGRAVHNPYHVRYDHWENTGVKGGPWEPENELEALP